MIHWPDEHADNSPSWNVKGGYTAETGDLRDGWTYTIMGYPQEDQSVIFEATCMRKNPDYDPDSSETPKGGLAKGFGVALGFDTIDEARGAAFGFFVTLRNRPGYPDSYKIMSV